MMASYFPEFAIFAAVTGISNAPGTHAAVIFSSSTPCRTSPSTAPPSSLFTIISLNLDATIPTFIPCGATTFPSKTLISFISLTSCYIVNSSSHTISYNFIHARMMLLSENDMVELLYLFII